MECTGRLEAEGIFENFCKFWNFVVFYFLFYAFVIFEIMHFGGPQGAPGVVLAVFKVT